MAKKLIVNLGGFGDVVGAVTMSQVSMRRVHRASDTQDPGHGPEAFSYFYSYLLSLIMATSFTPIVLLVLIDVFCMLACKVPFPQRLRPSQGV